MVVTFWRKNNDTILIQPVTLRRAFDGKSTVIFTKVEDVPILDQSCGSYAKELRRTFFKAARASGNYVISKD